MSGGQRLVGAVAALRTQGALLLPVGLASCVPAFLGGDNWADLTTKVGTALILFVVSFGGLLTVVRRRHKVRLDHLAAPLPTMEVVANDRTFELFSRTLTGPLVMALALGVFISYKSGLPVWAFLLGFAACLLWQAQWLAAQERELGGRIVCLFAPLRVAADDPDLAAYVQARFWIVREGR